MSKWGAFGILCIAVWGSVAASAQQLQGSSGSRVYTVAPGRTIPLGQHYSSVDCIGTGVPELTVLQSPSLGTVTEAVVQTRVEDTPLDASGRPRPASHMACVGRPITVLEVRYKAGPKRGTESFSYQLSYPAGNTGRIDVQITVR